MWPATTMHMCIYKFAVRKSCLLPTVTRVFHKVNLLEFLQLTCILETGIAFLSPVSQSISRDGFQVLLPKALLRMMLASSLLLPPWGSSEHSEEQRSKSLSSLCRSKMVLEVSKTPGVAELCFWWQVSKVSSSSDCSSIRTSSQTDGPAGRHLGVDGGE